MIAAQNQTLFLKSHQIMIEPAMIPAQIHTPNPSLNLSKQINKMKMGDVNNIAKIATFLVKIRVCCFSLSASILELLNGSAHWTPASAPRFYGPQQARPWFGASKSLFLREYIHFARICDKFPRTKAVNSQLYMGSVPTSSLRTAQAVTAATAKQRMLKLLVCSDAPEQALRYRGFRAIAGVDEVGRGALFGPVVAAAVILPERLGSLARAGLKDSKQLTREEREKLDRRIRKMALAISVAEVDAETIDRVNIYQATRIAMLAAVQGLTLAPDQTRLFYGDALSLSIAAASVVAKVHRDRLMRELDTLHPGYGLASHKGYGTPEHRRSLIALGPCALHRRSFAPVRALITGEPKPTGLLFDDLLPNDPILEDILLEDADLEAAPDL
jgi:ribonuclease HII